jgi:hypothetical protein
MIALRWVIYRDDTRVLQWQDSEGEWHAVREVGWQTALREDQIAQEDKADREREQRQRERKP